MIAYLVAAFQFRPLLGDRGLQPEPRFVRQVPFSPYTYPDWSLAFVAKLLVKDRQTLALVRSNPFPETPPHYIGCRFVRYRFANWQERHEAGQWWVRSGI